MAQDIIIKNSPTPAKIPLVSDLELGELAINSWDGKLFIKKDDGVEAIIDITGDSDYNNLTNIPTEFTPEDHTHVEVDITDLDKYNQAAVDGFLDQKTDLVGSAVNGNLAGLDATGQTTDSGVSASTFATAAQGATADTALQNGDNVSELVNDSAYLVAADITSKADDSTSILSGDTALISITNPTLGDDVTIAFPNINQANGIVKIGGDGFIPIGILPAVQKALIGSHDASGNSLPADATLRGEYYVIEVGGTLQLARADDGFLEAIVVSPGDEITYTGRTGDWFYQVGRSATAATAVTYDNTANNIITGADVQTALGDLDTAVDTLETTAAVGAANKADKIIPAATNNIATLDATGNLLDSGSLTSDFATFAQGATADTATQPGDNISTLTNDSGYLTNAETIDGGTY